jgi:hypothetical protein
MHNANFKSSFNIASVDDEAGRSMRNANFKSSFNIATVMGLKLYHEYWNDDRLLCCLWFLDRNKMSGCAQAA